MIIGSRKSYDVEDIKKSQKDYFLLIVDGNPIGISTAEESAIKCVKYYAKKLRAKKKLDDWTYLYSDSFGWHLISIEKIKRIKMSKEMDEE